MFFLICASLLFSMRGSNAQGAVRSHCEGHLCITIPEGDITAEPGSRVVIPCNLVNTRNPENLSTNMIWYKCDKRKRMCSDSEIVFRTDDSNVGQSRVSALEPNTPGSCAIAINDVTASDSGSYQVRVGGFHAWRATGFTFKDTRVAVSVRANGDGGTAVEAPTQKPTVTITPGADGEETTLTCTAPGDCSGSPPTITWTIPESITAHRENNAQNCVSQLIFTASKISVGTEVTCKVSLPNNMITEETVTLDQLLYPLILDDSHCVLVSGVLTCVCVTKGSPLPTVTWPLLKSHTDFSTETVVSEGKVSSTVKITVTNQDFTTVKCVSRNDAGEVQRDINVVISEIPAK